MFCLTTAFLFTALHGSGGEGQERSGGSAPAGGRTDGQRPEDTATHVEGTNLHLLTPPKKNANTGRRRTLFSEATLGPEYNEYEVTAASDAELCGKVQEYLETDFFLGLLKHYAEQEMDAEEATEAKMEMAEEILTWCQERADGVARRRADGGAGEWNIFAKNVRDDLTEIGIDLQGNLADSEAYLDSVRRLAESNEFMSRRRIDSVDLLPEGEYNQCAAYSHFTAQLIGNLAHNGAAEMILNKDKVNGCGAIVNSVNAALKSDALPHVQVITLNGQEVAVTDDHAIADKLNLKELHAIHQHKVIWYTAEEETRRAEETSLNLAETPMRRLAKITAAGSTFVLMTLCQSYKALAASTAAAGAYQAIAA